MRKIKLMLITTYIMAVFGGLLAFKVNPGGPYKCIYTSTITAVGDCPFLIKDIMIRFRETEDENLFIGTLATPVGGNCPALATCTINSTYENE